MTKLKKLRAGRWISLTLIFVAVVGLGSCRQVFKPRPRTEVSPGTRSSADAPRPGAIEERRIAEGDQASAAGEYDRALTYFQEVLAKNPTLTVAYLKIGDIYILQENYNKAEPAYGRAARLEPRNFDAQYGHALALQLLNRFIEAVRTYQRALTIDPQNVKANLNLATTYLQMNEAASAITFAKRAVVNDPSNGAARVNLGAAYEHVGRYADAIEQYTAAMELVENTPPVMINLINALAAEKRYQEAANTAENLVRTQPSADAYERLGWCYFRMGQYDKSTQAYKHAVDVNPRHWPSHNGIGVNAINAWLLSKRRDVPAMTEAREAFRASLRVNRDQPKVIALMTNYGL